MKGDTLKEEWTFGIAVVYFLRSKRLDKIIRKIKKFTNQLPMHVFFHL